MVVSTPPVPGSCRHHQHWAVEEVFTRDSQGGMSSPMGFDIRWASIYRQGNLLPI
jgi:hypothetical protein